MPKHSSADQDLLARAERELRQSIAAKEALLESGLSACVDAARLVTDALLAGGKLLLCGNGGSAADAQHIAAEFVGRFQRERQALPAICLTTNTSTLTAVSNDYSYEVVFARQVEAFGRPGDVLIGISTSGNSPNVLEAMRTARRLGVGTIGLSGAKGHALAELSDVAILVPTADTQRIQESHITIGHILCALVEESWCHAQASKKSSHITK